MRLHNCKYVLATGTTGRYAGCDVLAHPEVNELYCLWNCGFYSNQVQVFSSLLTLARHGITPDRIDYSLGFCHFTWYLTWLKSLQQLSLPANHS